MEVLFINKNFDRKGEALVNENIEAAEVLVVDENGESLGAMSRDEAISIAMSKDLDLVCVAPNAKVPVCRFADFSKFRYEQQRKAKVTKKNQKNVVVKEIWLTPVIGGSDYDTKLRQGRKFLMEGNKLKVMLRFRSYRMLNLDIPKLEILEKFIKETEDIATVEARPLLEGKNMSMILVPKKNKK